MDISKIFDKAWHDDLLYKLETLEILGNILTLFQSSLNNKFQRVAFNGQLTCLSFCLSVCMYFRKLFGMYEQNLWKTPVKEFFFSVYNTPGYICYCSLCNTLTKIFDISFSKTPRNSMFIHLVYNEDRIIYFLYIIYLF